jgi:predicted RNase H-like nuclease (RuvC/YqgF family)
MFDNEEEYAKLKAELERLNEENKKLLAERNEMLKKGKLLTEAVYTLHKNPQTADYVRETLSQKGITPLPKSPFELEEELKATREEMRKLQFQLQLKEDYERKMAINQKYGLMPDAETVEAVTKYMTDNGIANYETAAKFYKNEMLSTKKSPVDDTYQIMGDAFKGKNDIFGMDNVKDLAKQIASETAEEYKRIFR